MADLEPTPQDTSRRRTWLLVVGIVAAGALLTWLAFGFGIQEKPPPDLTQGVDLVPATDRGGSAH